MSKRMRRISDIQQMMKDPEQIRNIGLIGHIDHGKTTLSDSLLAEAGLLSESLAGEARVLDFLEEEQRRGITMKSANISLYYEHSLSGPTPFLINLVDTPGHLDFSGKVTRALRMVDGVVVIVDSVEEVSSQTETVVRQALEEAVRPILFVNKIDRLFRELKLDADQIKEKFSRIIQDFNKLIFMYGDEYAKEGWLVSAEAGSVIFGSALHRWGFTIPHLIAKKLNFEYFSEKYHTEKFSNLYKKFPVWESVLEAVVKFLPNPLVAQKYRLPTIWSGDPESDVGKAMAACDPNGPLVICLSKVQMMKNRLIGTGRVFSGTLGRSQRVWLVNSQSKSAVNQLSIFMGSRIEAIDEIPAGNIAAIGGIKNVKSGETIYGSKYADVAKPFENVKYVSEPVVTVAIEPDMLKNLARLEEVLHEIEIEDPNITVEVSSDTGEVLLSGMGPLHLEVVAHTIKDRGVEVSVSKPTSVFRESVDGISRFYEAVSPNGLNKVKMLVMRIDPQTVSYLRTAKMSVLENEYLRQKELPLHTGLSESEAKGLWAVDKFQNIIISQLKEDTGVEMDESLDESRTSSKKTRKRGVGKSDSRKVPLDLRSQIIKSIQGLSRQGSIAREPMSELKIVIRNIQLAQDKDDANFFELSTMLQEAFTKCVEDAKLVLQEPIYNLMITSPENHIGTVTSLINQFQGKILKITQDTFKTYISAVMSVRHSIEFSNEVRNETSGRVFWQALFDSFQPVPEHQIDQIVQEIKFRKGLSIF